MSEHIHKFESSKKSERCSPQSIVEDYQEIRLLVEWMIFETEGDNPTSWEMNKHRLIALFAKHGLPTDDLVQSCKEMRAKATLSLIELNQEI